MSVMLLVIGALGAFVPTWVVMRRRLQTAVNENSALAGERDEARRDVADRERQLAEVRGRLETQVARLETELAAERKGHEEKLQLLEQTKCDLTEVVKATCVDAYTTGSAQIVELASARLKAERAEGKRELEQLVAPVGESLVAFKSRLDEIERAQVRGRSELSEQLKGLGQAQKELLDGTSSLVGALRRPQIRGRWGEVTLKRVVETAGMLPHVDFTEQPTLTHADGRLRPDLMVHLPGGKEVIVDSKVPLEAYLDAVSATDDGERRKHLEAHARQLRDHIKKLSDKRYWEKAMVTGPDFVFCFVPNDQVLAAAAEADPRLMENIEQAGVFPATPMTLMVLLRVVAVAWQQEQVAESARSIWKLGRDLHGRLGKMGERIETLRRRLAGTLGAFNDLVGTYQGRVLPAARRFNELGPVSPADRLPTPERILETPRPVEAPEVANQDADDTSIDADTGSQTDEAA